MTSIQDNIIEISTVVSKYMPDCCEDWTDLKQEIVSWAEEFERINKDVDWDERFYYEEIEEFTEKKLKEYVDNYIHMEKVPRMIEMELKKSNLQSGMIVETRKGMRYIVIKNSECYMSDLIINMEGWMSFDYYDDDLKSTVTRDYDIMKVYSVCPSHIYLMQVDPMYDDKIIMERETPKKMTLQEIEEALGHKVEIVP